jgi:omega-6 fatty acid desaturase (delta-12 desaturase)
MSTEQSSVKYSKVSGHAWKDMVANYHSSEFTKSMWQFINSFIPFVLMWVLAYLSLDVSYWLSLAFVLPASGFIMRIFIIQHDCGHGSFLQTRKANDLMGMFCSIFTLTPYHYWRKSHAIHHANAGKTENQGAGDFYTLTVREYLQRNKIGRLKYRLYRNPLMLFLILPPVLFYYCTVYRFSKTAGLKSLNNTVYITNAVIGIIAAAIIFSSG